MRIYQLNLLYALFRGEREKIEGSMTKKNASYR